MAKKQQNPFQPRYGETGNYGGAPYQPPPPYYTNAYGPTRRDDQNPDQIPGYGLATPNGTVPPPVAGQPLGQPLHQPAPMPGGAPQMPAMAGSNVDPNLSGALGQEALFSPLNFSHGYRNALLGSGLDPLSGSPAAHYANLMAGPAQGGFLAAQLAGNAPGSTQDYGASYLAGNRGANNASANNMLSTILNAAKTGLDPTTVPGITGMGLQAYLDLLSNSRDQVDYVMNQMPVGIGWDALQQYIPSLLMSAEARGGGTQGPIDAILRLVGMRR